MDEEKKEEDALNPDEEADLDETADADDDELKKAKELANNYKIRAEKAESLAKQLKNKPKDKIKEVKEPQVEGLGLKDIRALSDVHDDDVDDVIDYAKFKGIPVAEAKISIAMQGILKAKKEERKTAEATRTGGSRGGSSKISDESLLDNASTGKLPESDAEIARLMKAKQARMAK